MRIRLVFPLLFLLLTGCVQIGEGPPPGMRTVPPQYSDAQKQLAVWGVMWFPPGATAAYMDPFLFANGNSWDSPADPRNAAQVKMFQDRYLQSGAKYKVIGNGSVLGEVSVQNASNALQTPLLGAVQRGLSLVTNDALFSTESKPTETLSPTEEQKHAFLVACESNLQGTGGAVVHQLYARDLHHNGKPVLIGVGSRKNSKGDTAGILILDKPHGNEYIAVFAKQFDVNSNEQPIAGHSNFSDFRVPFVVGNADIDHDGIDEVVAISENGNKMTYHVIGFSAMTWRDRYDLTRQE